MIKKVISISFGLVLLMGCQAGEDQTNIELIQDMMEGPQIKAQEGTADGKILMKTPPKGAIPRGFKPYPFAKDDIASADTLKSPKGSLTAEELLKFEKTGKEKFEIYCGICHGNTGKGDGAIAKKMLKAPPSLLSSVYQGYSDGRLFNVATNGWGLMGGYMSQIPVERDRWAVVNYVRTLQKSSN